MTSLKLLAAILKMQIIALAEFEGVTVLNAAQTHFKNPIFTSKI